MIYIALLVSMLAVNSSLLGGSIVCENRHLTRITTIDVCFLCFYGVSLFFQRMLECGCRACRTVSAAAGNRNGQEQQQSQAHTAYRLAVLCIGVASSTADVARLPG